MAVDAIGQCIVETALSRCTGSCTTWFYQATPPGGRDDQ